MSKRCLLPAILLLILPRPLATQEPDPGAGPAAVSEAGPGSSWRPLRISKWASFAATLGAAVYGVSTVRAADDRYEELEQACLAAPVVCGAHLPDGSYVDTELEQRYQAVLRQDRRARTALLASQLGAATTVVLFILDLRHARDPADVPYRPPRGLQLTPRRDGLELRLSLPSH
jgi:hypothetical protein